MRPNCRTAITQEPKKSPDTDGGKLAPTWERPTWRHDFIETESLVDNDLERFPQRDAVVDGRTLAAALQRCLAACEAHSSHQEDPQP